MAERWYDGSPDDLIAPSPPSDCSPSVSILQYFRPAIHFSFPLDRLCVPGRMSRPSCLGVALYLCWLERRAQLSHPGLAEPQRIPGARLRRVMVRQSANQNFLSTYHCMHAMMLVALLRLESRILALFPEGRVGRLDGIKGTTGNQDALRGELLDGSVGHPEPWLGERTEGGTVQAPWLNF